MADHDRQERTRAERGLAACELITKRRQRLNGFGFGHADRYMLGRTHQAGISRVNIHQSVIFDIPRYDRAAEMVDILHLNGFWANTQTDQEAAISSMRKPSQSLAYSQRGLILSLHSSIRCS